MSSGVPRRPSGVASRIFSCREGTHNISQPVTNGQQYICQLCALPGQYPAACWDKPAKLTFLHQTRRYREAVLHQSPRKIGGHYSWQDAIDTHSSWPQFQGQTFGQSQKRCLAYPICTQRRGWPGASVHHVQDLAIETCWRVPLPPHNIFSFPKPPSETQLTYCNPI